MKNIKSKSLSTFFQFQEKNNFKKYDANEWITRELSDNWDPIIFYICANIQKCVISIQADVTHEYKIFPDETPKLPPVRFGRLEQFKFVYLGSGRKLLFFLN